MKGVRKWTKIGGDLFVSRHPGQKPAMKTSSASLCRGVGCCVAQEFAPSRGRALG